MSKNYPTVSVVIPVKNEAKKIRDCIEGILSQSVPVQEIIVLDSGSTDGTIDILSAYKDRVEIIHIKPEDFNHGETRNVGIRKATGEFVLLTVGDAKPYDKYWISNMLKGFEGDENVAGVCGAQVVPHDKDKNPAEWFRPVTLEPQIVKYKFTQDEFNALPAEERKNICSWDDVTAMYRRDMKEKIPFRITNYAEDAQWAKDAILAGYTIAYNPAARVYHYHLEDIEFAFKRNFTVMYYRYKIFDFVYPMPKWNFRDNLSLINIIRKAEGLTIAEKIKWWQYNIDLRKGLVQATETVHSALEKGETFLDELHQQICGRPPVPKK